ncbi:hypothetical protein FIBSPDRAFT_904609 [Athelia psychrophila]|uniref:Uncharacterized protein n=1 Tax=Athelia psychrophila TaxID=1759441 RepID=A0A167UIM6_9AGAM|nr:hypothetical protein FIBSPDRAFT_904609 [Fibularhizoctonia sp. CBS 109695]
MSRTIVLPISPFAYIGRILVYSPWSDRKFSSFLISLQVCLTLAHQLSLRPCNVVSTSTVYYNVASSPIAFNTYIQGISLENSTNMLKRLNQHFVHHIINYQVPTDPKSASKNTHEAIRKYLNDGKLGGNQIKGGLQPLTRYRLLLQMGSILGYDVHDTTYSEHIMYENTLSDRFRSILKELTPWYGQARVISNTILSGKALDDIPSIWKSPENGMEVSAEMSFQRNLTTFAANISTLVRSIMDSQKAIVHHVKGSECWLIWSIGI